MTKQVQRRRGTATQHTSFTGAEGELSVNTTNKSVHVHDGATAGGIELARKDGSNVAFTSGTLDGVTIGGTTAGAGTFTNLTATGTTTLAGASTSADITFGDNDKAIFGAGSDLQMFHLSSNNASYIQEQNATGSLYIEGADVYIRSYSEGDNMIIAERDGAVTLHYDNSAKLATTSTGISVTGNATFANNDKAIFGASNPLEIYHDGSNKYIQDTGGGSLFIRGSDLVLEDESGNDYITMSDTGTGGTVTLKHNASAKLATTSTGVDITGTAVTDGVTSSGVISAEKTRSNTAGEGQILISPSDTTVEFAFRHDQTDNKLVIDATTSGIWGPNVSFNTNKDIIFYDTSGNASFVYDESAGSTFNEQGADRDFRVESDGNANMIKVDAASNHVYIGTSSGYQQLTVNGNIAVGGSGNKGIYFGDNITSSLDQEWLLANNASSSNSFILYEYDSGTYVSQRVEFLSGGNTRFDNGSGTELVINEAGNDADFRVEADSNSTAFVIDAAADSGAGVIVFGQPLANVTANGGYFTNSAENAHFVVANTQTTNATATIYCNRQGSDGTFIEFRQANQAEGSISVSGSTVSYNGFSGRHESSGIPTTTARGTVVSTIDELDEYLSGTKQGQTRADHAKVEVSDSVGDPCVYGVVDDYTDDGSVNVISVGIAAVRVTGACAKGDLLESNGDGTAKVQSDDIVRSKTLGKVTIGNSDTGVKLVSCVMYCG